MLNHNNTKIKPFKIKSPNYEKMSLFSNEDKCRTGFCLKKIKRDQKEQICP